jgi:ABC-2 type transport system ATP-binding protein
MVSGRVTANAGGAVSAIEVQDLYKSYGDHVALRGINFQVNAGEIVGFLGPNGAGKTTAMRILTGYFAASSGAARIAGHDVLSHPIQTRRQIGYLPESAPIYGDMRIRDFLDYIGQVRAMGTAERARGIDRVAQQCGLTQRLGQRIDSLSKGYRQRVGLAQALIHEPSILILDEPTTGLDPNQIVDIRNLIREVGRSKTVLLSTHILSEVQATCDRVVIINQGAIVADGPVDAVTTQEQGGILVKVIFAPGKVAPKTALVEQAIGRIRGVQRVSACEAPNARHHAFEVLAKRDVRQALFAVANEQGLELVELAQAQSNLEEVFRRLTQS